MDVREPAHQRHAVQRLELIELAAIDDACDDLAHVVWFARVGRNHPVQIVWVDGGSRGATHCERDACVD